MLSDLLQQASPGVRVEDLHDLRSVAHEYLGMKP